MGAREADNVVLNTLNRDDDDRNVSREDVGKMLYGCEHYKRRCKIRAPCCDRVFPCRHCHNDATSASSNPKEIHEIVRQDVNQVVCAVCDTEQKVARLCSNCGVNLGEYFCDICKFYDDDVSKKQFHCSDCGICRVGGRENYFHCPKCVMWCMCINGRKKKVPNQRERSCYAVTLRDNHVCVEDSMKHHCPICYEFLFDSIKQTMIMKCGHTIHGDCFEEMVNQNQYRCPICSKSVINMSTSWESLNQEIEATAMPEEYRREVQILCNDCNNRGTTFFHIFGHKCQHCSSYNTRVITTGESQQR